MKRRAFITAAGTGLASGFAGRAFGQAPFEGGTLTVINPFPPGGGTDTSTRVIMKKLQENTNVPVVVESRPGGNTLIGTEALVRAAPDGRTIALVTNNFATNETLYRGKLRYNLFSDIAPISLTHGNAHVLLVHPSVPANTFEEFIALTKRKPGQITFVSAGSGTTNHLCGELLKAKAGIDMVHVPYKGIGTLLPDLLSGRVDVLFGALPIGMDLVREKKLRMLAVTTANRQPEVPDLPAIAEYYPGYAFSSWFGYVAPGATPPATIDRLNAELNRAVRDPDTKARLPNFEIFGTTPAEFIAFLKAEIEKSAEIIRTAKVTVE